MTQDAVHAVSVRELVRRRRGDEPDIWHLALVQRGEVWDHVRMRYLLDSLLAGYPIGSLLLCKVSDESGVIRVQSGERQVADADPDTWQLLDGQQRINALFSIFSDAGYGRFYLHMTMRRDAAVEPVTTRRAIERSVRYIHWESDKDAEIDNRDRYIDLSRWYEWGKSPELVIDINHRLRESPRNVVAVLRAIDERFGDNLDEDELDTAADRLRRLLRVWCEPIIPVQYLQLASPRDVLDVFTRINRAGVQVASEDLFFAAVKTLWKDAEPTIASALKQLTQGIDDPPIDRLGMLRVLARLAARATGQADLVPLAVDRLNGDRGALLIDTMRALSAANSKPLERMAVVLRTVFTASRLGFGLFAVDRRLWDDVLGWAAVNGECVNADWVKSQMPGIDAYLFAATSFRYPSVLRDPFARLSLREALTAGLAGEPFPTTRIAEVARALIPDLRQGRTRIPGCKGDEQRFDLVNANHTLFLSVVQRIPYAPQVGSFDWDHIFPMGKAHLMWAPGEGGRRRHHPYRRYVNSAGNLWALDCAVNRAAQDHLPARKFACILNRCEPCQCDQRGKLASLAWPRERWSLTNSELAEFHEIGEQLQQGGQDVVESAMERFYALVKGRAVRIANEVLAEFPEARLFASDSDTAATDPSPDPQIAPGLGIEATIAVPESPRALRTSGDRVEQVFALATERGCGDAMREFVSRAVAVGLGVRGHKLSITITPPRNKVVTLIALEPHATRRGLVRTWVYPTAFAAHFRAIPRERIETELGGFAGSALDRSGLDALARRLQTVLDSASVEEPQAEG